MAEQEQNAKSAEIVPKTAPSIGEVVEVLYKMIQIIKEIRGEQKTYACQAGTSMNLPPIIQKAAAPYCLECGKEHSGSCKVRCTYCYWRGHPMSKCPRLWDMQANPDSQTLPQISHVEGPDVRAKQKQVEEQLVPRCPECLDYHFGKCRIRCHYCYKNGHHIKHCPRLTGKAPRIGESSRPAHNILCYHCGQPGHYRNNCPMKKKK